MLSGKRDHWTISVTASPSSRTHVLVLRLYAPSSTRPLALRISTLVTFLLGVPHSTDTQCKVRWFSAKLSVFIDFQFFLKVVDYLLKAVNDSRVVSVRDSLQIPEFLFQGGILLRETLNALIPQG